MAVKIYKVGDNLFDAATNNVVAGKYIASDGTITNSSPTYTGNSTFNYTDYIPVEAGKIYKRKWTGPAIIQAHGATVAWYNSSKTFITRTSSVLYPIGTTEMDDNFTAPNNASYAIINFPSATWPNANVSLEFYDAELTWRDITPKIYNTSTDTITSLPKTIIGDGQPISAYTIKGNLSQSGTPTPTNPIYPTETGDKTANLFDITNTMFAVGYGGNLKAVDGFVDFTVNGNTIEIDVRETSHSAFILLGFCESGSTYTVTTSVTPAKDWGVTASSSAQLPISFSDTSNIVVLVNRNQDVSKTFTVPEGLNYIWISTGAGSKYTVNISNIMLNTGSTPLPYEPWGYKIPILSGGQTTPVYLGEVQSTRLIKKFIFDGTEDWVESIVQGRITYYYKPNIGMVFGNSCLSSHYKPEYSLNNWVINVQSNNINVVDNRFATVDDFKSWLASQYTSGTPVMAWVVLTQSRTTTLNEPIRKIGNYADSVTGTGLPTTGTAEQFDVSTTLKPSEVSLTYHGWHEHSDEKYVGG